MIAGSLSNGFIWGVINPTDVLARTKFALSATTQLPVHDAYDTRKCSPGQASLIMTSSKQEG